MGINDNESPEIKIKFALWNCRSIRDNIKTAYLRNILLIQNIGIAVLNETFLSKGDKLFIRDFKIYRSDAQIRRKGVAILISKNLDVKVEKLESDELGRFLKISLTNQVSKISRTIGTVYIEPTAIDTIDIPENIIYSDFLMGDLNGTNIRKI